MKLFFLTTVSLIVFSIAFSQSVKKRFSMADLQFMAGQWKASSDWGEMEEFWSTPNGNCMMCSFRCVKDGKVVFYEFVVIELDATDEVPVMKLRHFNPGSIGWEDKENPYLYPLVSLEVKKAVFESADKKTSLSYERVSEKTLKSVLTQEKDGKQKMTEFIFSQ